MDYFPETTAFHNSEDPLIDPVPPPEDWVRQVGETPPPPTSTQLNFLFWPPYWKRTELVERVREGILAFILRSVWGPLQVSTNQYWMHACMALNLPGLSTLTKWRSQCIKPMTPNIKVAGICQWFPLMAKNRQNNLGGERCPQCHLGAIRPEDLWLVVNLESGSLQAWLTGLLGSYWVHRANENLTAFQTPLPVQTMGFICSITSEQQFALAVPCGTRNHTAFHASAIPHPLLVHLAIV